MKRKKSSKRRKAPRARRPVPKRVRDCAHNTLIYVREEGGLHTARRLYCRSWRCLRCGRWLTDHWRRRLRSVEDVNLAFTLSIDPRNVRRELGEWDLDEVERRLLRKYERKFWDLWAKRFRSRARYFAVVEWQGRRGVPHLHVLVRSAEVDAATIEEFRAWLAGAAARAGFGSTSAELVWDYEGIVNYTLKYPDDTHQIRTDFVPRFRRVRASRSFFPKEPPSRKKPKYRGRKAEERLETVVDEVRRTGVIRRTGEDNLRDNDGTWTRVLGRADYSPERGSKYDLRDPPKPKRPRRPRGRHLRVTGWKEDRRRFFEETLWPGRTERQRRLCEAYVRLSGNMSAVARELGISHSVVHEYVDQDFVRETLDAELAQVLLSAQRSTKAIVTRVGPSESDPGQSPARPTITATSPTSIPRTPSAAGEGCSSGGSRGAASEGELWRALTARQSSTTNPSVRVRRSPMKARKAGMTAEEREFRDLLRQRDALDVKIARAGHALWKKTAKDDVELERVAESEGFGKKALYFVALWRFFRVDLGLAATKIQAIGWSKLALLFAERAGLDERQQQDLVSMAEEADLAAVRARIRELVDSETPSASPEKTRGFYAKPTESEMEIIERALAVSAVTAGTESRGCNLALVSSVFLAYGRAVIPVALLSYLRRVLKPGGPSGAPREGAWHVLRVQDAALVDFVLAHEAELTRKAHADAKKRAERARRATFAAAAERRRHAKAQSRCSSVQTPARKHGTSDRG